MHSRSTSIMIIEDNDDDFEACQAALTRDNHLANPLCRCETGDEALDYLFGRGAHVGLAPPPKPSLILLDLNLPGANGRDVLAQIKADAQLQLIPVVVMTTSADERDIEECYRAGANSYIVKPVSLDRFFGAIARLREYWFEIVLLPEAQ